ncbi:type II toxin-antitoxin system death-on-curing family toxin [Mycobacterium paraterrae]|uniref:Type II toxin-antitoxin system death-on-curing family toxin n=1 Tax=Mycobacterium paraterrae TaxID=577492 RepID=A0ABY3VHY8_9MYCO|nr:type II toxin-antitoxin system death-on-curing family toxin [Mycobacterium paraterrae]UMB69039.1 type II toxin-antitoxin system death-on-curing family toxin [Mycobacterium paraterrae]
MIFYLERDDVVVGGSIACGFSLAVSDEGLLQSAVARPQTSVMGDDAYPTLWDKAAALLHSLARNYAFVDGNKRTAWASAWAFLRLNGIDLPDAYDVDYAEQLVLTAAVGDVDWPKIADGLRALAG